MDSIKPRSARSGTTIGTPELTYQRSYLARLNYVHQNAVKHGLVPVANQYPWCSAAWFEREASPAMVKAIYRFKVDQVKVYDDFEPEGEWL
jgi:putative transposase